MLYLTLIFRCRRNSASIILFLDVYFFNQVLLVRTYPGLSEAMLKTMNGNTARVIGANKLTNDIATSTGTFFNLNLRNNDRLLKHCATTTTGRYASGSVRVNVTWVTRLANSHIWHSLQGDSFCLYLCVLELTWIRYVSFIYSWILLLGCLCFLKVLRSTYIFFTLWL